MASTRASLGIDRTALSSDWTSARS
jgi:hypothetical protein